MIGNNNPKKETIPLALEFAELRGDRKYYGRIVDCLLFRTDSNEQRLGLTIKLLNFRGGVSFTFPTPIPCYSPIYQALTVFKGFNKICCEDLVGEKVSFDIDFEHPHYRDNSRQGIIREFKFLEIMEVDIPIQELFTFDTEEEPDGGIDDIPNVLDDEE